MKKGVSLTLQTVAVAIIALGFAIIVIFLIMRSSDKLRQLFGIIQGLR